MAFRYIIATLALAVTVASAAQDNPGMMSVPVPVPGARTGLEFMAAATDGLARYFKPDGPIQPALTAIGTLPVRGIDQANGGITRISSGLNNQAQRLWQASGQAGPMRAPGLDTAESFTPEVITSMAQQGQNLIRRKNSFIMDQATAGIKAAQRAGERMHNTLQQGGTAVRSSGPSMNSVMETPAKLMSSAHEFITKGASKLQQQAQEHLNGVMGRMGSMQDMGQGAMGQVQGITRTLQKGAQGVLGQFQQTGEELMSQIQRNHQKNMQSMSGGLGSLQGSMGKMGSNMQSNMDDVRQHAQKTVHELTEGFQKMAKEAADAPMKVLSSLSSMMSMKGGSSSSGKGGRY